MAPGARKISRLEQAAIYLGGAFIMAVIVWVTAAFMTSEGLWP